MPADYTINFHPDVKVVRLCLGNVIFLLTTDEAGRPMLEAVTKEGQRYRFLFMAVHDGQPVVSNDGIIVTCPQS